MGWWKLGAKRRRGGVSLSDVTDHLMIDLRAETADPSRPAFMSPPDGSPPFHGFQVLDDVEVDGFRWGGITDFERFPGAETGDAFIVAPDGSRAGIEWRTDIEAWALEMAPGNDRRWGNFLVGVRHPMISRAAARQNLGELLPHLVPHWERWRDGEPGDSEAGRGQ